MVFPLRILSFWGSRLISLGGQHGQLRIRSVSRRTCVRGDVIVISAILFVMFKLNS
uniref:Uncharacterized protein n=1 Tax=Arundo donax TaxID=35708 RepID=A0A0A9B4Y8_ARUDO